MLLVCIAGYVINCSFNVNGNVMWLDPDSGMKLTAWVEELVGSIESDINQTESK